MDIHKLEKTISDHFDKKHIGELSSNSIYTVQDICNITNPNNILEIGFNRGCSALMWLEYSNAHLTSIDIVNKPKSINYLKTTYPNRFDFKLINSNELFSLKSWVNQFDLIFIDGDHSHAAVKLDAENSIKLNAKYIAFDDYNHWQHGTDIKNIINDLPLEIIKEYKTGAGQALVKNLKYKNNE